MSHRARIAPGLVIAVLACALSVSCGRAPVAAPVGPVTLPALIPPLCDAQRGEELVLHRGEDEWRYVVEEASESEVVVQIIQYSGGTPVGKPQRYKWFRNGFGVPETAVIRRIERARLDQDGRVWQCWLMHVATSEGLFYYWISDEVAVHGVLKIARADKGSPDDRHALYRVTDSLGSSR